MRRLVCIAGAILAIVLVSAVIFSSFSFAETIKEKNERKFASYEVHLEAKRWPDGDCCSCKEFIRSVLTVLGGSIGGGYYQCYLDAGEVITDPSKQCPGDIIQTFNPTREDEKFEDVYHSAFFVAFAAATNVYAVRDSNYGLELTDRNTVKSHDWDPFKQAAKYKNHRVYFYRIGSPIGVYKRKPCWRDRASVAFVDEWKKYGRGDIIGIPNLCGRGGTKYVYSLFQQSSIYDLTAQDFIQKDRSKSFTVSGESMLVYSPKQGKAYLIYPGMVAQVSNGRVCVPYKTHKNDAVFCLGSDWVWHAFNDANAFESMSYRWGEIAYIPTEIMDYFKLSENNYFQENDLVRISRDIMDLPGGSDIAMAIAEDGITGDMGGDSDGGDDDDGDNSGGSSGGGSPDPPHDPMTPGGDFFMLEVIEPLNPTVEAIKPVGYAETGFSGLASDSDQLFLRLPTNTGFKSANASVNTSYSEHLYVMAAYMGATFEEGDPVRVELFIALAGGYSPYEPLADLEGNPVAITLPPNAQSQVMYYCATGPFILPENCFGSRVNSQYIIMLSYNGGNGAMYLSNIMLLGATEERLNPSPDPVDEDPVVVTPDSDPDPDPDPPPDPTPLPVPDPGPYVYTPPPSSGVWSTQNDNWDKGTKVYFEGTVTSDNPNLVFETQTYVYDYWKEKLRGIKSIEVGKSYAVSVTLEAVLSRVIPEHKMVVDVSKNSPDWGQYGGWKEFPISSGTETHTYSFVATGTDPQAQLGINFGRAVGRFKVTHVSFGLKEAVVVIPDPVPDPVVVPVPPPDPVVVVVPVPDPVVVVVPVPDPVVVPVPDPVVVDGIWQVQNNGDLAWVSIGNENSATKPDITVVNKTARETWKVRPWRFVSIEAGEGYWIMITYNANITGSNRIAVVQVLNHADPSDRYAEWEIELSEGKVSQVVGFDAIRTDSQARLGISLGAVVGTINISQVLFMNDEVVIRGPDYDYYQDPVVVVSDDEVAEDEEEVPDRGQNIFNPDNPLVGPKDVVVTRRPPASNDPIPIPSIFPAKETRGVWTTMNYRLETGSIYFEIPTTPSISRPYVAVRNRVFEPNSGILIMKRPAETEKGVEYVITAVLSANLSAKRESHAIVFIIRNKDKPYSDFQVFKPILIQDGHGVYSHTFRAERKDRHAIFSLDFTRMVGKVRVLEVNMVKKPSGLANGQAGHTKALTPETIRASVYPNPFNSQVTVSIQNPKDEDLSVRIFNLLGQEVAVLADGYYSQGEIVVTWDGKDKDGIELSSGVYLIVLYVKGGISVIERVVLVR